MIWTGARVLMGDGQTLTQVDALQIGQSLFNPVTGQPQEITDILKRKPRAAYGTCPTSLRPVLIRKGSLGRNHPSADIWLSQAQEVLVPAPSAPKRLTLTRNHALILSGTQAQDPPRPDFCYAALFRNAPGTFVADGLMLAAYDVSILGYPNRRVTATVIDLDLDRSRRAKAMSYPNARLPLDDQPG